MKKSFILVFLISGFFSDIFAMDYNQYAYWLNQQHQAQSNQQYEQWLPQQCPNYPAQYNPHPQLYEQWLAQQWQNYQAQCNQQYEQWLAHQAQSANYQRQKELYNQWLWQQQQYKQQQAFQTIGNSERVVLNQRHRGKYRNNNIQAPRNSATLKEITEDSVSTDEVASVQEKKQEEQYQEKKEQPTVQQDVQVGLEQDDQSAQEVTNITDTSAPVSATLDESRSNTNTPDFEIQYASYAQESECESDASDDVSAIQASLPASDFALRASTDTLPDAVAFRRLLETTAGRSFDEYELANTDEEFNEIANQKVQKEEKLSKYKQAKNKKLFKLQERLDAKRRRQRKENAAKSKLSANSDITLVQEIAQPLTKEPLEEETQVEQVEEEAQEEQVPAKEKKDLRLHAAIQANKSIEVIESLITQESLDVQDNDGNYALNIAVITQNLQAVTKIIEKLEEYIRDEQKLKERIDAPNNHGFPALHYAVVKKHFAIVDYLLSKGANRDLLQEKTKNRLVAMAQEHKKQIEVSTDVVSKKDSKYTPDLYKINAEIKRAEEEAKEQQSATTIKFRECGKFIKALRDGKLNWVKEWIYKNPKFIKVSDPNGDMALHIAVLADCERRDKEFKITKFLVLGDRLKKSNEENTNIIFEGDCRIIYEKNSQNLTPFHLALLNGHLEMCKFFACALLDIKGIDFTDFFMNLKRFAICKLAESPTDKSIQQIIVLLDNKLKQLINKNNSEQTFPQSYNKYLGKNKNLLTNLLFMNVQNYTESKANKLPEANEQLEDIMDLISAGAELTMQDNRGATYLHRFAELGNHLMVEYLLNHGADPEACDLENNTPLHWAADHDYPRVASVLLNKNPELKNAINKLGDTPAHMAAYQGHREFIELLIKFEADMQIKNKELLTPVLQAIVKNQSECFNVLRAHAKDVLKISLVRTLKDCIEADKKTEGKYPQLLQYKEYVLGNLAKEANMVFDSSKQYLDIIFEGDGIQGLVLLCDKSHSSSESSVSRPAFTLLENEKNEDLIGLKFVKESNEYSNDK